MNAYLAQLSGVGSSVGVGDCGCQRCVGKSALGRLGYGPSALYATGYAPEPEITGDELTTGTGTATDPVRFQKPFVITASAPAPEKPAGTNYKRLAIIGGALALTAVLLGSEGKGKGK